MRLVALVDEVGVVCWLARSSITGEDTLPHGAFGGLGARPHGTTRGALVEVLPLILVVHLCWVQVDAVSCRVLAHRVHQSHRASCSQDRAPVRQTSITRPNRVNVLEEHHLLGIAGADEAFIRARKDVLDWKARHSRVRASGSCSDVSLG